MLVDDRRIRVLNRDFRGKDESTDVLSFPQLDEATDDATAILSLPQFEEAMDDVAPVPARTKQRHRRSRARGARA
jgi:ssRNA-specific RNase YbeY (16S rRNA maturation enzyme)